MGKYILSLDQGTTGSTAALIDKENFQFIDSVNEEFPQIFPHSGWVEHDLSDIYKSINNVIKKLIEKNDVSVNDIECIGITNQRETTCAFDKSGNPICNAIVWQDRRTSNFCEELKKQGLEKKIKEKTGLPIDAYFSASKMKWILDNVQKEDLLFGTIDTFLIYKLSDGKSYKTESSNASRTMLMNLQTNDWDKDLLNIFGISSQLLPEISESFSQFGTTKNHPYLPDGIPITGVLGDQQSALFGQAGINEGDMKCTYGTGAFLLLNTGEQLTYSQNGLLTTSAFTYNSKKYFALEGSCYIAGAAIQWLRDNLNFFSDSSQSEEFALKIDDLEMMKDVLFFPFFTGIGSPHWKQDVKATISGLTRNTNKYHITRAALEGVAFSIKDLIKALESDYSKKITQLNVDGGMVKNNLLLQIQADILNTKIIKPKVIETTAYGAAIAAGVGHKIIKLDQLKALWKFDKEYAPSQDTSYYQNKYSLWSKGIEKL